MNEEGNRAFGVVALVVAVMLIISSVVLGYHVSKGKGAAEDATKVLCIGIIANTENPAHDDREVLDICAGFGVTP